MSMVVRYNFDITEAEISRESGCKRRPAKHLDFLSPLLEGRRSTPEVHPNLRPQTDRLVLIKRWNLSEHLRCYFAMGKIRGTSCARRHISAHRATTKYFSNSFVFKTKIEKEGLPRDRTPDLGAAGPRFESRRPDQNIPPRKVPNKLVPVARSAVGTVLKS
jgi:hypothetical protein